MMAVLQEQADVGVGVDTACGGLPCQGPTRIVFYPPDIPTALNEAHLFLHTKTYRQQQTDVLDKQIRGQTVGISFTCLIAHL